MSESDRDVRAGVSLTFFSVAMKCLLKEHGNRLMGPGMETFRFHLQEAERAWKSLEPIPKQPRKKRCNKKS